MQHCTHLLQFRSGTSSTHWANEIAESSKVERLSDNLVLAPYEGYCLPSMTICDKYSGWYAHTLSLRSFTIFPLHLITWTSRGFIVVVAVVVAMADVNGVPSRCVTSADDRLVNSWSWSSWSSTTPESSNDESRLPPPSLAFELAWRLVGSNCPR